MSFVNHCESLLQEFTREYGERDFRKIYDELTNSLTFKKNLPVLTNQHRPPNSTELIAIIQNIRFFAFSSKRNTSIAATILLMMWNQNCNCNNLICDDSNLLYILENVHEKSSKLLW
ncbi:hypothetical protein JW887_03485 [Candidatus Dojkabacteria bacterium]|nr:hypothetical protein [Candidatus Dojkabacteria bacterium]